MHTVIQRRLCIYVSGARTKTVLQLLICALCSCVQQTRRQSTTELEEMKAGIEELKTQMAQVTP